MELPKVDDAERYRGLYVYDSGEWTAIGYTAEEIAILLEDETTRGGKIYKIHRALPDGSMELRGVAESRFHAESGMFFYASDAERAEADYATLVAAAEKTPPPCRTFVHQTDRGEGVEPYRYVVALIHPAEYEDEIGRWLLEIGYQGGEIAEGGASHVSNYNEENHNILQRRQLWTTAAKSSRSRDELRATFRQAVQR